MVCRRQHTLRHLTSLNSSPDTRGLEAERHRGSIKSFRGKIKGGGVETPHPDAVLHTRYTFMFTAVIILLSQRRTAAQNGYVTTNYNNIAPPSVTFALLLFLNGVWAPRNLFAQPENVAGLLLRVRKTLRRTLRNAFRP